MTLISLDRTFEESIAAAEQAILLERGDPVSYLSLGLAYVSFDVSERPPVSIGSTARYRRSRSRRVDVITLPFSTG